MDEHGADHGHSQFVPQSNEPFDQEDAYIESVADPVVQHDLRWQQYLTRLSEGAWGDPITLAAVCQLFNLKLTVFHSYPDGTRVATLHEFSEHEIKLGLLMKNIFVALDELTVPTLSVSTPTLPTTVSRTCATDSSTNDCNGDIEIDDLTIAEGDQHTLEITGGTHASILSLENPEQIVSVAPAEGQKPLFIMSDPQFELMCNPDKFCFGTGGFSKQRPRKLTYRKYFNARLLDIDGRFSRDLDYLFVAQYIVECKQVLDDGNNFAWRQKPARSFTASQVRDSAFLSLHVRTDKAYRFLKNVRGSPPYYQRTFYDLLAMIRQLGTPT